MKKNPLFNFFAVLTAVTTVLFLIYFLLVSAEVMPSAEYDVQIFLGQYLVTLLVYFLLLKALSLDPSYFVQIAILSIVVKLIIYGVFNFVMIYLSPDSAYPNVILFFSIYIVLTALELTMIYPVVNLKQKERQNQLK